MGDYRNSLLSTTDIASKYLINLHNRGEGETVSIGEEVGGLMSPVGILEEKAEEDLNTDGSPLNVQNAAVNSIHGAVANNLKTEQPEYYNYTIKSGDTLGRIASDSGVDMAEIVKLNDIADPNKIRAGAMLRIPTSNVEMFETATGMKFPEEPSVAITPVSPMSKGFVAPIELQDTDTKIANKLKFYAEKYDLPLDFVTAICANESSFTNVVGDKSLKHSAYGPMQVRLPALQDVQRYYGLEYTEDDLKGLDLNASIETGVAYLAMLRDNYGAKSLAEIATMYNGGPSAVKNRNANALKYASKVMDFRDRAMKEFNRMIKVTELGPHVSDGDEMFGVVSGGVTKPETEDRDDLLDASLTEEDFTPETFDTLFSGEGANRGGDFDLDAQTSDFLAEGEEPLVAKRGTPRFGTGTMPMVNYLTETNKILANADITDAEKVSQLKAGINELTTESLGFPSEQNNRFSFSNPFVSMAAASTLDPSVIEKPAQLLTPEKINEVKVNYSSNASEADIKKAAEPNSTWRNILNIIPPNARLYLNDVFKNRFASLSGRKAEFNDAFTEKHLSEDYLSLLKDIVKDVVTTKEGGSSQIIEYADYKSTSKNRYEDVQWDKVGLPSLDNKRYNLKTSFGQSVIRLNEKGELIIKDRFNFNDGEDVDSIQAMVSAIKDVGGSLSQGQVYGALRKYGKYYGSQEGEGQYISVNLGKATDILGEDFDLSKLRLTSEAAALIAEGQDVEPEYKGLMTKATLPAERPESLWSSSNQNRRLFKNN